MQRRPSRAAGSPVWRTGGDNPESPSGLGQRPYEIKYVAEQAGVLDLNLWCEVDWGSGSRCRARCLRCT